MADWFALLGPLGYPLAACSVIAVAIILERAVFYLRLPRPDEAADPDGRIGEAVRLLRANRGLPRADRNDLVGLWLAAYAGRVRANLRWLGVVAAIAPMLGLLGTVLGMTGAFKAISDHTGPVSPQILSGGLWEAMLTTLAGLSIAIPVLVIAQVFKAVASGHLDRVAAILNRVSLEMDGASLTVPSARAAAGAMQGSRFEAAE